MAGVSRSPSSLAWNFFPLSLSAATSAPARRETTTVARAKRIQVLLDLFMESPFGKASGGIVVSEYSRSKQSLAVLDISHVGVRGFMDTGTETRRCSRRR